MSVTPGGMPDMSAGRSCKYECLKVFVGQVCTINGYCEGRVEKIEDGWIFLVDKKGVTHSLNLRRIDHIMKKP